jgi:molybdopterin/thiamine biosynthesis adenylyltransferase
MKGIPFVHGAAKDFYGQATTIIPGENSVLKVRICRGSATGDLADNKHNVFVNWFHSNNRGPKMHPKDRMPLGE